MYFPKTGELETFWTNYTCTDPDCPGNHGKARKDHRAARPRSGRTEIPSAPRGMRLTKDEGHLDYSPGHWDHDSR